MNKKFFRMFDKFGCDENASESYAWVGFFVGKKAGKIHIAVNENGRCFVGKKAEEAVLKTRAAIKEFAADFIGGAKNLN